MQYSSHGYRIHSMVENDGPNWLFFPGGPGLGSEYLVDFCQQLKLPGTILLLDFPMDGTNTHGALDFQSWQEGLLDIVKKYANPILVTHSFSGMFVMNMPEIENYLSGLVMMNTTTQNSFFEHVHAMQLKYDLPDLVPGASVYHLNPSSETYRAFWDTYRYYCFTAEEIPLGEKMIELFAFNNASYHYAIQHFYPEYTCKLKPSIPVMTIASEKDYVCPPDVFMHDPNFQSKNVINKMIKNAGHCPWILHFDEVQACFDEFIQQLKK